jgi:HEPN domain-containing protein
MTHRQVPPQTSFATRGRILPCRKSQVATSPQLLELLCFHAQQACEKSLKGVLVHFGTTIVKTHNLQIVLDLVAVHCAVPAEIAACSKLTDYAVTTRHPGVYEPVTLDEYSKAVNIADAVVRWAEHVSGAVG